MGATSKGVMATGEVDGVRVVNTDAWGYTNWHWSIVALALLPLVTSV